MKFSVSLSKKARIVRLWYLTFRFNLALMITFSISSIEQEVSFWMYSRTLRLTIIPKKKTFRITEYPANSRSLKEPSPLLDFNRRTTVKCITQSMRQRCFRLVTIWIPIHINTEVFNSNKEMKALILMTLRYPVTVTTECSVCIPTTIIIASASYRSTHIKRVLQVMYSGTKPC